MKRNSLKLCQSRFRLDIIISSWNGLLSFSTSCPEKQSHHPCRYLKDVQMCCLERWFNGAFGSVILMVGHGQLTGPFQAELYYDSFLCNGFSTTVTEKILFKQTDSIYLNDQVKTVPRYNLILIDGQLSTYLSQESQHHNHWAQSQVSKSKIYL